MAVDRGRVRRDDTHLAIAGGVAYEPAIRPTLGVTPLASRRARASLAAPRLPTTLASILWAPPRLAQSPCTYRLHTATLGSSPNGSIACTNASTPPFRAAHGKCS